ncbi:hypothetical protein RV13_GL000155 [Enterococcus raffinosus]|nr:hypothetical protein RV13_GL000155 [Enterococcus raffinosus]
MIGEDNLNHPMIALFATGGMIFRSRKNEKQYDTIKKAPRTCW